MPEKERLEKEQEDHDSVERMRLVLEKIMEHMAIPPVSSSMFYVPMTDDEYFNQYQFESGYDNNGDWYSTWEAEGFDEENYLRDTDEED